MHHFLLKHSKDVDLAIITMEARFTFAEIAITFFRAFKIYFIQIDTIVFILFNLFI